MSVENGDGALHAPDGHDGAGLEAVGVVAERGRWEELPRSGVSRGLLWCA